MGLLDVLNGMQNGPRGSSNPGTQSGGGMSPLTMAILGLLAWKAVKHLGGNQASASPAPSSCAPVRRSLIKFRVPQRVWSPVRRGSAEEIISRAGV